MIDRARESRIKPRGPEFMKNQSCERVILAGAISLLFAAGPLGARADADKAAPKSAAKPPAAAAAGAEKADAAKVVLATPPTAMDAWDLAGDFAKIEQQFAAVEEILTSEEYSAIRVDSVSHWSCGTQAGHISFVMKAAVDGIEKNLADPTRHVDGKWNLMAKPILTKGNMPRGVATAPIFVMPLQGDRESWLKLMRETRERWRALEARSAELAACPSRFKHPMLGFFTSSDWVRFAPIHTAHHLKIVRDILAASPPATAGEHGKSLRAPAP